MFRCCCCCRMSFWAGGFQFIASTWMAELIRASEGKSIFAKDVKKSRKTRKVNRYTIIAHTTIIETTIIASLNRFKWIATLNYRTELPYSLFEMAFYDKIMHLKKLNQWKNIVFLVMQCENWQFFLSKPSTEMHVINALFQKKFLSKFQFRFAIQRPNWLNSKQFQIHFSIFPSSFFILRFPFFNR